MKRTYILAFFMSFLLSGCGALHQLPVRTAEQGPFKEPNNEFEIGLPVPVANIKTNSHKDIYTVDYIVTRFGEQIWYSLEWNKLSGIETEQEFYENWKEFLPRYLSGNFGDGNYKLLNQEQQKFKGKYPSLRFLGVGQHNGGKKGSIYGTAINFGSRVAVVYVLRNEQPTGVTNWSSLPDFAEYEGFVQTLTCLKVCSK